MTTLISPTVRPAAHRVNSTLRGRKRCTLTEMFTILMAPQAVSVVLLGATDGARVLAPQLAALVQGA